MKHYFCLLLFLCCGLFGDNFSNLHQGYSVGLPCQNKVIVINQVSAEFTIDGADPTIPGRIFCVTDANGYPLPNRALSLGTQMFLEGGPGRISFSTDSSVGFLNFVNLSVNVSSGFTLTMIGTNTYNLTQP